MKIAVLISSLRCGGTERTASLLANAWVENGLEIEILTLSAADVAPFFPLDARIKHTPLDLQQASRTKFHGLVNNGKRVHRIRNAFKHSRPDLVVAFMEGTTALAIIAARGMKLPVVISEVAVPALQNGGWLWNSMRKLLYPKAALLIVPSKGVQTYFNERLRLPCEVIPNPVALPPPVAVPHESGERLVAVGRLSPEKGFDLLLHAFARIRKSHAQASLTIFGEGPLRSELVNLRDNLGLQQHVAFPGTSTDLAREMQKADIFVLSSKYEGFGNVLCEAMAVGLPVVSFDCPTGPREIIRHGVDGLLVPPGNVEKLAEVVSGLLSDCKLRTELSRHAPQVVERFGLPRIARQWQMAFERAVQQQENLTHLGKSFV